MFEAPISLTYEAFFDQFKPVMNPIHHTKLYDGCLFDTTREELSWVNTHDPLHIWTLLDADGTFCIVSGAAFVNRLGYFVTEIARSDADMQYEIVVSGENEEMDSI